MTTPATLTDADRQWVEQQVAKLPAFTPEQRSKLAELLRPIRQATTG